MLLFVSEQIGFSFSFPTCKKYDVCVESQIRVHLLHGFLEFQDLVLYGGDKKEALSRFFLVCLHFGLVCFAHFCQWISLWIN